MNQFKRVRPLGRVPAMLACTLLAAACSVPVQAVAAEQTASAAVAVQPTTRATPIGDFEGSAQTDPQHGTWIANGEHERGWGWAATDDARLGGHSTASIALTHPGAVGSQGALRASGEVKSGFISPWAGAIWFPGTQPMQAADLSGTKALSFRVRGTPGSYTIMLMAGSPQNMPEYASFDVGSEWQPVTISFDRHFHYADLEHVYFIAFSAASLGAFQLDLDQVRLH